MNGRRNHSIDVVFVLVLFCTFAISVLMVLMVGASSYNDVTDSMTANYEDRTGVGYIAEKVRHYDADGGVDVGSFDGQNALILNENIDGEQYATYIYCYDGFIRELFTEAGNDLPPEAGEEIIQAEDFQAEKLTDGLIRVTCTMKDGSQPYIVLQPRTEYTGLDHKSLEASAEGEAS